MGGCYSFIKYLLVIFNFIFWIFGIVGVVFSVWLLVDKANLLSLTQDSSDYTHSVVVILVTSILLILVAGIGIYGALRESQCALTTFFCFLLIIGVAEVSAGLWCYIQRDSLEVQVKSTMKETVEREYNKIEHRHTLFDVIQKNLQCCGVDKAADWIGNKKVNIEISAEPYVYSIPTTCCRERTTLDECQKSTSDLRSITGINYEVIYDKGCYDLVKEKLSEYAYWILGIGLIVVIMQALGLIFSLILACTVNKSNRYKA